MKELRVMKNYMAEITLPTVYTAEFLLLIPEQIAFVNKLMSDSVITSYTLTLDRRKLWVAILGSNKEDIFTVVSKFPLFKYMDVTIHELAFHNIMGHRLPELSMN